MGLWIALHKWDISQVSGVTHGPLYLLIFFNIINYVYIFTWNSTDNFFSIQSVIWVTVTCLAPTLGFATNVNLGFPLNPYLKENTICQFLLNLCIPHNIYITSTTAVMALAYHSVEINKTRWKIPKYLNYHCYSHHVNWEHINNMQTQTNEIWNLVKYQEYFKSNTSFDLSIFFSLWTLEAKNALQIHKPTYVWILKKFNNLDCK